MRAANHKPATANGAAFLSAFTKFPFVRYHRAPSRTPANASDGQEAMPHRNLSVSRLTLFEKLFEQAPDPVLVTDLQGLIVHVNAQVEESFGYGRSELIGKPVETLIPQRFRSLHDGHRHAYSMSPHRRRMGLGLDLHGCRKDGTEFPVDIMLNPVQVGEHQLVLCVVRDIT